MSIREFIDRMNITMLINRRKGGRDGDPGYRTRQHVLEEGFRGTTVDSRWGFESTIDFSPFNFSTPMPVNITDRASQGDRNSDDKIGLWIALGILGAIVLMVVAVYVWHYRRIGRLAERVRRPVPTDPYANVRNNAPIVRSQGVGGPPQQQAQIEIQPLNRERLARHSHHQPVDVEMEDLNSQSQRQHSSQRLADIEVHTFNVRRLAEHPHPQPTDTDTQLSNVQRQGEPFRQQVTDEHVQVLNAQRPEYSRRQPLNSREQDERSRQRPQETEMQLLPGERPPQRPDSLDRSTECQVNESLQQVNQSIRYLPVPVATGLKHPEGKACGVPSGGVPDLGAAQLEKPLAGVFNPSRGATQSTSHNASDTRAITTHNTSQSRS